MLLVELDIQHGLVPLGMCLCLPLNLGRAMHSVRFGRRQSLMGTSLQDRDYHLHGKGRQTRKLNEEWTEATDAYNGIQSLHLTSFLKYFIATVPLVNSRLLL